MVNSIFDKYSCQGWCMRPQPPHVRRFTTGGTPTVPESWLKVTLWLNITRATLKSASNKEIADTPLL